MNILKSRGDKFNELDYKGVNTISSLAVDMITNASSGHIGSAISSASIIYTLYKEHMKIDLINDKWINRDRFILSNGHAVASLYAMLYLCGFKISLDDLKSFRKHKSKTPGHPEVGLTPGIDATTGMLGEGVCNAVGMAIAEAYQNERYKYKKNESLIDHYTYVLCGDGDLMEGSSYEAISYAGTLGLGKLILLYDNNYNTIDGNTKDTFSENVLERLKAMKWDVMSVSDGGNLKDIDDAIIRAKSVLDRPSFIEIKTTIGKNTLYENSNSAHSKVLNIEEVSAFKNNLNMKDVAFNISKDVFEYVRSEVGKRNLSNVKKYDKKLEKLRSKIKEEYLNEIDSLNKGIYRIIVDDYDLSLFSNLTGREASSIILDKIITDNNLVMGSSSDLLIPTKTNVAPLFLKNNLTGKILDFGVRDHCAGSIINGMTLSGIRMFYSSMLILSDYLKPSIRLAALMKLPNIYLFTHDSILVGEDGATHQPIEQLISLRSIPNIVVYKPSDINELIGSYRSAIYHLDGPSVIVVTKELIQAYSSTSINDVSKGAYIIKDYDEYDGILVSSGNELKIAIEVEERLYKKGLKFRIVSIPSIEIFETMDEDYKEQILQNYKECFIITLESPYSWYKYAPAKNVFGITNFGFSAKKEDLLTDFGFDKNMIADAIENNLKK